MEGIYGIPVLVTNAVDRGVRFGVAVPSMTYRICDAALDRTICIGAENSTGVNLWNPGAEKNCPGFISGDEWRRFVAVEPYAMGVNRFLVLKPQEKHVLRMKVRIEKGVQGLTPAGKSKRICNFLPRRV